MYSKELSSPSGAWASSCLCAPFRAFRFARPCPGRYLDIFSPDTAPGAVGEGRWFLSCKFTPHHKQQEKPRNYYFPILEAHRFTGRQAQFGKCQGA